MSNALKDVPLGAKATTRFVVVCKEVSISKVKHRLKLFMKFIFLEWSNSENDFIFIFESIHICSLFLIDLEICRKIVEMHRGVHNVYLELESFLFLCVQNVLC